MRKSGDGLVPVDGASGAFDWTGMIPFDQIASALQPGDRLRLQRQQRRFRRRSSAQFRASDYEETFRARRIQQFFDTISKHSLETSAAMQADHLSLDVKEMQPFIATIAPSTDWARQAQAMLLKWDGVMAKDRAEPLIYTAFLSALHKILLEDKTGVADGRERPVLRDDPHFPHARPSLLVRLSRRPRPGLPQGARPRSRRRSRAPRQARRQGHEPMGMGRGAPGAVAPPGLRPCPAL